MMWWRTSSRVDPEAPNLPNGAGRVLEGSCAAIANLTVFDRETQRPDGGATNPDGRNQHVKEVNVYEIHIDQPAAREPPPASSSAPPVAVQQPAPPPENAAVPLSPGRSALAAAISVLRQATAAMEAEAQPARRLDAIIAEARDLDQQLAASAADHHRELGSWLANSSQAERPTPSAATVGLRQRRAELADDLAAAEAALPTARHGEQEAASRAAAASRRLVESVAIAAADAARELFPRLMAQLEEYLALEGQLRGLEAALRTAGNQPHASNAYFAVASEISDAIAEIKRTTGAPINVAAGERLLAALANNPEAVLQ